MNAERHPHILDLPEWELPQLEKLESAIAEELAALVHRKGTEADSLEDAFAVLIHGRLMDLVQSGANEAIEFWLKGLADGNNAWSPELCVDLPFLERGEATEPLTLTYCVESGEGKRTELNRTTLEDAMSRLLDDERRPAEFPGRAKVAAGKLRELAQRLEEV